MKTVFFWSILASSFVLLLMTSFRGMVYHDEGYILSAAARLVDGQVIYRDFHFAYTPGSVFLTALFFQLFGQSIFVERIIVVLLAVVTTFLIYLISKQFLTKDKKPKTNNLPAGRHGQFLLLIPILIFLSWGPMHTNFVWPVMIAILTGLATCYWFIKGIRTRQASSFFIAGILTTLTFLCKQNFGIGLLGIMCLSFVFSKNLRAALYYILGIVASTMIFVYYLLQTHSLIPFWQDFQTYTIQRIIIEQSLNTPFFYGTTIVEKIAKALLYLFPAYTSLAAIWILFKQKSPLILLPLFCLVFYILGIRPTTDYNHLAPLLALSGIPLLVIIISIQRKQLLLPTLGIALLLMVSGFITAFFKGYYQWQMPLYQNNVYVDNPRIGIWLNPKDAAIVTEVWKASHKYSPHNKYIFVNDYAPMLYFITGKQNPTKFDLLSFTSYYQLSQKELIQDIEKRDVSLIVTGSNLQTDTSLMGKYIKKNFKVTPAIQDFYYFYRE